MKNYLAILALLILSLHKIEAQKIKFGIKGGADIVYGLSHTDDKVSHITARLSYDLGLLLRYRPLNFFQIQFESGFIEKGYTYETAKVKFKHGYISNQLVFIFKPIQWINLEIGPDLDQLLYAKSLDEKRISYSYGTSPYVKTQFSGIVGIGFNLLNDDYIDIRYNYAFTPFIDAWNTRDSGSIYHFKVYEPYLTIGLKHYF